MNALPTFAQLTSDKKILCIPCGIILKNRLIFNMKHCKDEQHISKLKEYLKQKNEKEEKKISEPKPIVDNDQESLKRKLLLHKDELLDENNDDDVQLPLGFFDKEKKGEDKRKSEIKKENNKPSVTEENNKKENEEESYSSEEDISDEISDEVENMIEYSKRITSIISAYSKQEEKEKKQTKEAKEVEPKAKSDFLSKKRSNETKEELLSEILEV